MATIKELRLSSPKATRQTYARILRAYNTGDIESQKFRDLVYGMTSFLQYWKFEKDIDIEKRIDELEKVVEARGI